VAGVVCGIIFLIVKKVMANKGKVSKEGNEGAKKGGNNSRTPGKNGNDRMTDL
jgi:hypothetical protein